MIGILAAHAVVLLLSWMFACIGALILGERSGNLFFWNRTFLVGLTAAAGALFPLSVLLPHHAMIVVLIAGAAALYWVHSGPVRCPPSLPMPEGAIDTILMTAIVLLVAAFAIINAFHGLGWDGYQIWATKGMVLYQQGSLTPDLWPESPNTDITRVVNYPPMVPMFGALVALLRGEFSWLGAKPSFLVLYLSLLISVYEIALWFVPRSTALAAVMLFALLPTQFDVAAIGGYADKPLAAVLAGALAAMLAGESVFSRFRSPAAWLLAGLLTVKNEGLILCWVAIAVIAAMPAARTRQIWKPGIVVAVAILLRLGYLRWTSVREAVFGFDLHRALHRISQVPGASAELLLRWEDWGLYWPAVLLATLLLLARGRPNERLIALWLLLATGAYNGIYLFTNWDMRLHMQFSYPRLLEHLSPVATIVLAAAFSLLKGAHEGKHHARKAQPARSSGLRTEIECNDAG